MPGRKVESRICSGQRREIYLKDIRSDTSRDVISAPRAGIFYCMFSFVYVRVCVCAHACMRGLGRGAGIGTRELEARRAYKCVLGREKQEPNSWLLILL